MSNVDPHSETWEAIETMLRHAIEADLREIVEPMTGERRSDLLRGRLDMAREILSKAVPALPQPMDDPDFQADPEAGY